MTSSAASEWYTIRVNKRNWNGQAADMRATLTTWDWRWETALRYRNVEIDFRDVDFMEPWALAMFTCFALALKEHGAIVHIGLSPANPSNTFFEQAGMLDVLHGAAQASTPPRESTGLCMLRTTRETELFAQRAAELIRGVDEAAADRVRYCVSEFGYNAAQHSHSAVGAVAFGQRYPNRRDVQIVVCDAGRGVLESLRDHYSELTTALEGLRLATLPRTSGAPQPGPYGGTENQGLGLFFAKEIAWRTGGSFWLVSDDGLLGVAAEVENGPRRIHRRILPWRGTCATVHLPDTAVSDFSDVLDVCHRLVHELERDALSVGLEFVDDRADFSDDALVLHIAPVQNDLAGAHALRAEKLLPAVRDGLQIVLDFTGVRFVLTSIAAALLAEIFRIPGALTKLSFRNCSKPTEMAIRTVAASSRATYRRRPE